MTMWKAVLALGIAIGTPALARDVLPPAPSQSTSQGATRASEPALRFAQSCGWYAIFMCSRSRAEAANWNRKHGAGSVIHTSSDEFPNFRAGYYCVVDGPTSQGRALREANRWRRVSPTAYAKNAC